MQASCGARAARGVAGQGAGRRAARFDQCGSRVAGRERGSAIHWMPAGPRGNRGGLAQARDGARRAGVFHRSVPPVRVAICRDTRCGGVGRLARSWVHSVWQQDAAKVRCKANARVTAREICFVDGFGFRVDLVLQNRKGPPNETKSLMISASSKRSRCWPLARDDHAAACISSLGTLHAAGSALARCRAPMLRTHGCLVIVIGFFRQRSSHRIYVAILMLPAPFADIDVKGTVCRQS